MTARADDQALAGLHSQRLHLMFGIGSHSGAIDRVTDVIELDALQQGPNRVHARIERAGQHAADLTDADTRLAGGHDDDAKPHQQSQGCGPGQLCRQPPIDFWDFAVGPRFFVTIPAARKPQQVVNQERGRAA